MAIFNNQLLAGHGRLRKSRYGYLLCTLRLYKDLLNHLKIQKVIVVGGSAGGPSATEFANDYPERTSALILISAVSEASVPGDKPAFYVGIIHLIQQSDYIEISQERDWSQRTSFGFHRRESQ